MRQINPRIIYGSISGFGQDGPYGDRPGVDQIAQGLGGLMSITGEPGRGPMRVGIPIADLTAGLYCAIGIMVANWTRPPALAIFGPLGLALPSAGTMFIVWLVLMRFGGAGAEKT